MNIFAEFYISILKNKTSQSLTFLHMNIFAKVYDHLLHFCLVKLSLREVEKKFFLGTSKMSLKPVFDLKNGVLMKLTF